MKYDVLYADDLLIVINKPAGLSVLPEGWDSNAPWLVKDLEESQPSLSESPAPAARRIWVVHRLDKVTSGVMVFALTADAHRALNIQFEKHETEKIYHAIAVGSPPWETKITKFPLRVNAGHRHRTMVDDKNGVRAETHFKVLKRNPTHTLLEARPMTGRTHQIRVHAYALGYPLLGDILYSAPPTDLIARPALHAYSLAFTHPLSRETMTFSAPYPVDFQAALSIFKMKRA